MKRHFTVLLFIVLTVSSVFAQEFKHRKFGVELRASFINNSAISQNASVGDIKVNSDIRGISGKLLFNYYINNHYAFFMSIGMIASTNKAVVDYSTVVSKNSVVAPLYFGARYYLISLSEKESKFKPYINGGIGVAFGIQNKSALLNVSNTIETTPAAYVGIGADLELTDFLKLACNAGYNLISDFNEQIGSSKEYSSAEVSFGFGFNF